MNKLFKPLSILMAIAFLLTACAPMVAQTAKAAPAEANYQSTLGKPVSDRSVANFIASNACDQSGSFQLCRKAGVALWMDQNQIVRTAYLYARESQDFSAYKGELPFGLATDDTRAAVELKLGQPKEVHAPQAGWESGLPDEASSPDHLHFWADYKRFGVTIIYDSPAADDRNANIQAILVNK